MRILDKQNNVLETYDPALGRVVEESIFVAHHEAVEAIQEQSHYEVMAEYPNGGRDVRKVIDVAAVPAKDAWDEYETILRYTPYTQEELAAMEAERSKPTQAQQIADLTQQVASLEAQLDMLLTGVTADE